MSTRIPTASRRQLVAFLTALSCAPLGIGLQPSSAAAAPAASTSAAVVNADSSQTLSPNRVYNSSFNRGTRGWSTRHPSRINLRNTDLDPRGSVYRPSGTSSRARHDGGRRVAVEPAMRRASTDRGRTYRGEIRVKLEGGHARAILRLVFMRNGHAVHRRGEYLRVNEGWKTAQVKARACCRGARLRMRLVVPSTPHQASLVVDDAAVHAVTPPTVPPPPEPPPTPGATDGFTVGSCPSESGPQPCILDPQGQQFVVRGVVGAYGVFYGEVPAHFSKYHFINYDNAPQDFAAMRSYGFNLVRVFVAADHEGYGTDLEYRQKLDRIVSLARAEGLVVEIANANSSYTTTLPWLAYLANRYRDDPYVWLQPMNEPNCMSGGAVCYDPVQWQREQTDYIRAIRATGFDNPIVVNGVGWSWNLSIIRNYPLQDANLILGAHRYANNCPDFLTSTCAGLYPSGQVADVRQKWADVASRFPMIVDEVGANDGKQFANSMTWADQFVTWSAGWTNQGTGSGLIAFNWRWPNTNTMVGAPGVADTSTQLSEWGRIVVDKFVRSTGG